MLFSIVTPVFNGLNQIKSCVGSIRGQEDVEYEHILRDGGSTDGTVDWAEAQPGIDVISEPDEGMYDAINKGWARARGEVFSWLNHDEQYLPGALESVKMAFLENPKVNIVFGDAIIVDSTGTPVAARREIPLRMIYLKNGFLYALSCTLFFRRELWDKGLLKLDHSYRNAGDYDLLLRLLSNGEKALHIPRYLSLFGVDGNNLTVTLADNMERETNRIARNYHALPFRPLRRLMLLGRYVERLVAGCYLPDDLEYDYATNENPVYKHVLKKRVKARFSYKWVSGIMEKN